MSGIGARALKRDASETTIYVAGLFERRITSNVRNLHNILADGRVVAQVTHTQSTLGGPTTDTDIIYLHPDGQGNVLQATDENGQVSEVFHYDPFGRRTNRAYTPLSPQRRDMRLGYTAHEHDDELNLINMKGRVYDPVARRFLTPDPLVSNPLLSHNYNRYAYVLNNPASLVDPTGFDACSGGEDIPECHNEDKQEPSPGIDGRMGGEKWDYYQINPDGSGSSGSSGSSGGSDGSGSFIISGVSGILLDNGFGEGAPSSDDNNPTDPRPPDIGPEDPSEGPGYGPNSTDNYVTLNGMGPGWDDWCGSIGCDAAHASGPNLTDEAYRNLLSFTILVSGGASDDVFTDSLVANMEGLQQSLILSAIVGAASGPLSHLRGPAVRGGRVPQGGVGSVRVGQMGEAAVRAAANIGPKIKIEISPGVFRIPDGLTMTVLSEVKNVAMLAYTRQLRDFASYARANGLRFDLWVRSTTQLSGPLREAVTSRAVNLRIIP